MVKPSACYLMIRNKSIPLRVPPHWINKDSSAELSKKIGLRRKASKQVKRRPAKAPFDPKNFIDSKLLHQKLNETSWAIEYLEFLINKGNYELVSSAAGRIESILLVIMLPEGEIESQTHVYKTLINALGPDRTYHILCPLDKVKNIAGWFTKLATQGVKVNYYSTVFDVTCWAQDPFVALYSRRYKNTILAESNDFNRSDDQTIASDVGAQSTSIFNFPSYYYLQGGNILDSLDYVLIGKDYVTKNTGRAFLGAEEEVLKSFAGLFKGKECLSVGLPNAILDSDRIPQDPGNCVTKLSYSGIWQPIFHIDMFITPTGIRASENGAKEMLLMGSLNEAAKALKEFPSSAEMRRFKKYCKTHGQYFEGIARQLEKFFEVVRIPIYPAKAKFSYEGVHYDTDYYLTYNNVVVESFTQDGSDHRNAYMPNYSSTSKNDQLDPDPKINKELNDIRICLDDYAAKIWGDLDFTVYPISRMESLVQSAGAIHCMTKVLRRKHEF